MYACNKDQMIQPILFIVLLWHVACLGQASQAVGRRVRDCCASGQPIWKEEPGIIAVGKQPIQTYRRTMTWHTIDSTARANDPLPTTLTGPMLGETAAGERATTRIQLLSGGQCVG